MKKLTSIILVCCIFFVQSSVLAIEKSDLAVTSEQKILKSRLKKEYLGYDYTITNNYSRKIRIENVKLTNGIDGEFGYKFVKAGGGEAVAVLWVVCGPLGIVTLGIAWLVGLVGTPIAWCIGNSRDKKARKESLIYTNEIETLYLEIGESIHLFSLIPKDSHSQLKVTVQDEKNKEIKSFLY